MKTQLIDYQHDGVTLEGYCAYDNNSTDKKPLILIAHDWSGKSAFTCEQANKLAEWGYIGFALDMYGKGKHGTTKEEKSNLMMPLINDRELLQARIAAALTTAASLPNVDTQKMGAIGFCFGGLCALDLARTSTQVAGVVSFHGLLNAPSNSTLNEIKSKVLVLHGFDDPMVSPEDVIKFGNEMTAAKADWQIHMYGNTMHAFTNPEANDPSFGTVYNKTADTRSFKAMKHFFQEVFGS